MSNKKSFNSARIFLIDNKTGGFVYMNKSSDDELIKEIARVREKVRPYFITPLTAHICNPYGSDFFLEVNHRDGKLGDVTKYDISLYKIGQGDTELSLTLVSDLQQRLLAWYLIESVITVESVHDPIEITKNLIKRVSDKNHKPTMIDDSSTLSLKKDDLTAGEEPIPTSRIRLTNDPYLSRGPTESNSNGNATRTSFSQIMDDFISRHIYTFPDKNPDSPISVDPLTKGKKKDKKTKKGKKDKK